jgi:hypothetical protein
MGGGGVVVALIRVDAKATPAVDARNLRPSERLYRLATGTRGDTTIQTRH